MLFSLPRKNNNKVRTIIYLHYLILFTYLPKWLTTETVDGEQMSLFEGHEALAETDKMDAAPRGNGRARVGN